MREAVPLTLTWIVTGGRVGRYLTRNRVWAVLDDMYSSIYEAEHRRLTTDESGMPNGVFVDMLRPEIRIVHGNALLVDRWCGEWASARGFGNLTKVYGIDEAIDGAEFFAPKNRNRRMRDAHRDADRLIGFPGGNGTNHMMTICHDIGMPVADITMAHDGSYELHWWPQK